MEGDTQSSSSNHDSSITEEEPRAASFITQIPEPVKLIAASFLVAIVLHYFFIEKKRSSSSRVLPGNIAGGEILGSADPSIEMEEIEKDDDECDECDAISPSEEVSSHPPLPPTMCNQSKKKKKVKPAKLASVTRNYDKLICEKPAAPSEEDDIEPTTAKDATNSSLVDTSSSSPSTAAETQIQQPPPLQLHSQAKHPGLSGYYNWHTTITSLYRIYAIPSIDIFNNNNNNTFHPAILPMHPSSERGNVAINITVVNQTKYASIDVYWIDYKGREVYKGNMTRGGSWFQTTYIGHPWTFRVGGRRRSDHGGEEEGVLMKYVPFRIAPSVVGAETVGATSSSWESGSKHHSVGTQTFTLRDVPEGYVTRNEGYEPACWVDDTILPEPPLIDTYNNGERNLTLFAMHEMQLAIQWSCFQLQREDAANPGTGIAAAKRLLQYLQNVCLHPDNAKYRKLRIGNRIFFESVYSTGARGVLLALGFEENFGYLECGSSEVALNYERLRQISDAMMMVDKTLKLMEESDVGAQPEGSDGYGRAGFGYAGQLNL
ncbi:hypothetical protein ACHAWT_007261 [Skeletonema menzelii]